MKKNYCIVFLFFAVSVVFSQPIIPLNNPGEITKFDFSPLKNKFENKRIICIGESEHRIETFNQCKSEFIQYLHKNLGYEVVAFESSIFNISNGYYTIDSDTLALKESLYGIWNTKSVLDLFSYSKKISNSPSPLIFSGFDIKGGLSYSTSGWLKNIFATINATYAEKIYKTDTSLLNKCFAFDSGAKLKFISKSEAANFKTFYNYLTDSLNTYKSPFLKQNILTEIQFKIIKQSILNRKYLADFLSSTDWHAAFVYRDSVMAQNIEWLVNDLFNGKKIILWAHDNHISKKTTKESRKNHFRSSVEQLPQHLKDQIETISLNFVKSAPKKIKKQLSLLEGSTFFVDNPEYLNGEFEAVIYFKNTEPINAYKLK